MHQTLIILDFGSQYTQLIARRVREKKVFCKILPYHATLQQILGSDPNIGVRPQGIILSGSPANVYGPRAPIPDRRIFKLGVPILGICYGLQLIGHILGGRVHRSHKREYGFAELRVDRVKGSDPLGSDPIINRRGTARRAPTLFADLPQTITCWMSHGDKLDRLPPGFERLAHTANSPIAAVANFEKKIYGVQFHPEVVHTPLGHKILGNFLFRICRFRGDWTPASFVKASIRKIRETVGRSKVVLGLSGGVDSSVAAVLIHRAIGRRLTCIFVDNGLLRLNEVQQVKEMFRRHFKMNLRIVDARKEFLSQLAGVTDPERKRKIIGRVFIDVFSREAKKLGKADFLAQGTLYPDVIESVSVHGGPTSTIKSHHNVGGLPKKMRFKLLEPLRELFKDEVREVGRVLKISREVTGRHPFPGPGLAVRIVGEVTEDRLGLLRRADAVLVKEIKKAGLYDEIWQAFAVFLPIKSVGVMGDERTYENAVAIRAVTSQDGMTADWARIPPEVLSRISSRIINEVRGINRVCYDISSKPPSTIEWE